MKKIITKSAALVMVLIIILNTMNVYAAETRFSDVTGHWAEKSINMLAEKGIVTGMGDGLFHPNAPVTTSQFLAMVLRSCIGNIEPIDKYWDSGYLDKALDLELISESDLRNKDKPILRRSAATIGHTALVSILNEADETDVTAAEGLLDINDCEACIPHVSQFYVKGIMIGHPDNKFYGARNLTRAEAAIVITKMIDKTLRTPQTDTVKTDPLAGHENDAALFAEIFPVSEDNPFIFASFEEVVARLENGTGIIVFAFPACPRCKNAFPVLEKAFKDMGFSKQSGLKGKILYYDIFDDRDTNNERYKTLVNYTKAFLPDDDNGNPRIYSPDVFFVSSGKIVGNHLDTVPSLTNPRDPLNEEQAAELLKIYVDLIKAMEDCDC